MKLFQTLKYSSLAAIAAFTFACGSDDNSSPAPVLPPKILALSPTSGPVGTLVTATGTTLENLDSVKLGKVKLSLLSTSATGFTFNVPANATTGKLYVYKGKLADSSQSFTVRFPKATILSPARAQVDEIITVTGSFLNNLDSVKVGPDKVTVTNNTESGFSFKVNLTTFSGKVYIYKGNHIDSTLTAEIIETSNPVTANSFSCLLNGKPFITTAFADNEDFGGLSIIFLGGELSNKLIGFFIPSLISANSTFNASMMTQFYYYPVSSSDIGYTADGNNGTSGMFKVTQIGPNSSTLRGTFNFVAKDDNGRLVRVTNGRLAIRFQ